MSATTDFIINLEDAQLAADLASYQVSTHLCQLSNLVWRGGRVEGPDLDMPLVEIEQYWIDAMREQLQDAMHSLAELEAANSCFKSCS